jgi:HPt (histidine-containing phosphotransfer) domain-containing protein
MLASPMDPQQKLQSMLVELWNQHRSAIEERVELLSRACDALREGTLDSVSREEAQSAAHKLAGVLGTFGRSEGTDLARRIEILLADPGSLHLHHAEIETALNALRKSIL